MVPKGIEGGGVGIGKCWRGVDEVEKTERSELKGVSAKGDLS